MPQTCVAVFYILNEVIVSLSDPQQSPFIPCGLPTVLPVTALLTFCIVVSATTGLILHLRTPGMTARRVGKVSVLVWEISNNDHLFLMAKMHTTGVCACLCLFCSLRVKLKKVKSLPEFVQKENSINYS